MEDSSVIDTRMCRHPARESVSANDYDQSPTWMILRHGSNHLAEVYVNHFIYHWYPTKSQFAVKFGEGLINSF